MKHLCCNKIFFVLFLLISTLHASVTDKSAIVYYGDDISYPMVGIHNYIIVEPENINVHTHGFSVYRDKMYAYVSLNEVDKHSKYFAKIKPEWIISHNATWNSPVLDIRNKAYQEFILHELIEPRLKQGFKNFFFDTLDSYEIAIKNDKEKKSFEDALASFINNLHKSYPNVKIIVNRGFDIIDKIHNSIQAVLFESYYKGLSPKDLSYTDVSKNDRRWLDSKLKKVKAYGLDIICVDYLPLTKMDEVPSLAEKLKKHGFIPYIANKKLNTYGISSKNAIKREILTLIDETSKDRMDQAVHQYGALVLEYLGYIEKLWDVHKKGLPTPEQMTQYSGVIVWLDRQYNKPLKLIRWIRQIEKSGIKVVFAGSFGVSMNKSVLSELGITVNDIQNPLEMKHNHITVKDPMIGFEIEPNTQIGSYISAKNAKPLLQITDENNNSSTLAAVTPWGGYALDNTFMRTINEDNLWTINPFQFFAQTLRLKKLPVPDPTTENGNRILFSHIDGDGFVNLVEWDPKMFAADSLYKYIFTKYDLPISVSLIGAEIEPDGMYPTTSPKALQIAKKIYTLHNIEGATHTFTHPFFWGKIQNGNLDEKYRLKVPGYKFSIDRELTGSLEYINHNLMPVSKPKDMLAKTIFWSGDCIPQENILDYTYKHNFLNINGGDTTITRSAPWQSRIAPLGLERGDYYQIYTGAENENAYTNDWHGPFWGFKKVVETFNLTNSPRRFKPIDIYYHLYSGSKRASLNALIYVYNWALKQKTTPLFTSEYIPKAMDYFTTSLAYEGDSWLLAGMKNLHTVRIEKPMMYADLADSKDLTGIKHFENHTYYSFYGDSEHILTPAIKKLDSFFIIDANAKTIAFQKKKNETKVHFQGYVNIKLNLNVPSQCSVSAEPKASLTKHIDSHHLYLQFNHAKEVTIDAVCK